MTALAVLEHIPAAQQRAFAHACAEHLTEGGTLVITVFSPRVDAVLAVLRILRLVDGMSLEQHYGYRVEDTVPLFTSAGFALKLHQRFQSRLNNLCVFSKELA